MCEDFGINSQIFYRICTQKLNLNKHSLRAEDFSIFKKLMLKKNLAN